MTAYGEYQRQKRLTARYRGGIRRYGTHGDPADAMIEAELTVLGSLGNPALPDHCAGVYFIASGSFIKIGEAVDPTSGCAPSIPATPTVWSCCTSLTSKSPAIL